MSNLQWFLCGMMAAWTPSLLLLVCLLRDEPICLKRRMSTEWGRRLAAAVSALKSVSGLFASGSHQPSAWAILSKRFAKQLVTIARE